MSKPEKKLFLLDAMALIYRAHFAFSKNPRVNSKGVNTGASFGFTNTLLEILLKQSPTHIAVAFDTSAPTFRHIDFPAYKAHREAMPEDIRINIPFIKKIIKGFNIPILELDGFEADDIIGTIAKQASKKDFEVFMMTPDKDFAQLVEEHIYLYKPAYMGNGVDILGVEEVKKKFEIEHVDQIRDFLGLMGDAADNIPGIPGVGAKTAVKFLKEYGSLEGLLENADQLKGKMKEKVIEFGAQGVLSKELATIKIDVPVEFNEVELVYSEPNREALTEIMSELEFRNMLARVFGEKTAVKPKKAAPAPSQMDMFSTPVATTEKKNVENEEELITEPVTEHRSFYTTNPAYHIVKSKELRLSLIKYLNLQDEFAFEFAFVEEDQWDKKVLGMSISYLEGESYFIPFENETEIENILNEFKGLFENTEILKVCHSSKYNILLLKKYGINLHTSFFDNMLAHYIIDPETKHDLYPLAENILHYQPLTVSKLLDLQDVKKGKIVDLEIQNLVLLQGEKVDLVLNLKSKLKTELQQNEKSIKLYNEVELPLVSVLAGMEFEGIMLDIAALEELSSELSKDIELAEKAIYLEAGEEFNIASPKQLGDILFEKMTLVEKPKKTKTGQYATGEEILSKLADDHTIVSHILDFREYQKLKSTYVDALPKLISTTDQRIHTDYRQAVAATGRLSSNNPNLQNIPIRTSRGREVRKAFVPRDKNHTLLAADYSQIELRIVASFAKDNDMIEAFKNGRDIHATTASRVFGVALEDVDASMRRKAKEVNFGLIYGMSAFGLAERLKISRSESKEIIDAYFTEFHAVKEYMDRVINEAKEQEFVETILGRRRYLRDINSRNATVRGYAERNAINAPIQGSAADIIKVAMIHVHDWMISEKLQSKMILQVHDELVFDVLKEEEEILRANIPKLMREASSLEVPLEVEIGSGQNWLIAH